MANSARQKVYTNVRTLIDALAAGGSIGDYTVETTPKVVDNQAQAFGDNAEVVVWVEMGTEEMEPDGTHIGDKSHRVALTVEVNILVRKKASATLVTEANNALQDIRNVIHASRTTWRNVAGADWVGFGDCSTDEGMLSYDNKILFSQALVFSYAGGPTW